MSNLFYEESIIKMITHIIRQSCDFQQHDVFLEVVDNVYNALALKDISHSVLSYAKIYLALALYYIQYSDIDSIQRAEKCFLHYSNLIDGHNKNPQDEALFYRALGKDGKDEEKL